MFVVSSGARAPKVPGSLTALLGGQEVRACVRPSYHALLGRKNPHSSTTLA